MLEQANGHPERIPFAALKATANRFGIVPASLKRHFWNHLAAGRLSQNGQRAHDQQIHAIAVVAAREARQTAPGAAVGDDPDKNAMLLLEELNGLARALEQSIERCELKGDERGVRDGSTALRGVVLARARLLGLLERRREPCPEPPPVVESPEFAAVVAAILAPLTRHPDARRDVLAALESLRAAS